MARSSEAVVRADCLALTTNQRPEKLAGLPTHHPPPGWPLSKRDRFFGRADDLWRIDFALDTLRGGDDAAACLSGAIEGIGGVGKTQLALEYVLRFGRRRFPGGIFWMDAEKGLDEQHHGILQALNPAVPDFVTFSKDGRKASAELSGALERASASGARILFVVDNIPEDSDGKLSRWCPALNTVTVLATSRAKRSGNDSTLHIPVGVLAPEAAVQLLSSQVTSTAPAADWQAVAEWVGRLPLALTLLNAALYSMATTIEDLARSARGPASQTAELDDLRKALGTGTSEEALRGISEAFSISYALLPPEAQDAARLLARLAPAPLPEVLISALGLPPSVRVVLRARSFVTDDGTTLSAAEPSVNNVGAMHRVLADFLRTRADSPAGEWERLRTALVALLARLNGAPDHWREMQACMAHARHVLRNRPSPPAEPDAAFAELAFYFSNCLGSLVQPEEAAATAQEAVGVYRRLAETRPEAFEPDLAMSLNNLSVYLSDLGRREEAHAAAEEAVGVYRRLAEARPEAFEPDLASALNNLSVDLSKLGKREKALETAEEAVRLFRKLAKTWPAAFQSRLNTAEANLKHLRASAPPTSS